MPPKAAVWQLHEAKARFSELFRKTREDGPQRVRHGGEAVVVVQAEEFDRMMERGRPASLVEFFRSAPTGGRDLDLSRKRDTTRTLKW